MEPTLLENKPYDAIDLLYVQKIFANFPLFDESNSVISKKQRNPKSNSVAGGGGGGASPRRGEIF